MNRISQNHARLTCLVVALVTALGAGLALAQQQVQFGTALDANTQLGSGGYNQTKLSSPMMSPRYVPGMSKPLYTPTNAGGFEYNSHNAFNPRSGYTATGYRGAYVNPNQPPSAMSKYRY